LYSWTIWSPPLPSLVMELMTGWQAVGHSELKTMKLFTSPVPPVPSPSAPDSATPTKTAEFMGIVCEAPTWVQTTPAAE
jgi:hypothetical protein